MMHGRSQRGFTLVEVMVVVAIIAILATLALSSSGPSGSPQDTARTVATSLDVARLRAISTGKMHLVRVEPGVVSVWQATAIGFQTTPTYEVVPIEATSFPPTVVAWAAEDGVQLSGQNPAQEPLTAPDGDVEFLPDGSANDGKTFYFTHATSTVERYRVNVYQVTGTSFVREGW